MATDYNVKPGACRTNVDLFDVVQHVYRYAADFNRFPIWNRCCPISLVVVSPHRDDGRDLIQRVKNLLVSDCVEGLRTRESVSVGNNSEQLASVVTRCPLLRYGPSLRRLA